jgi:hypothetical protein
MGKQIPKIGFTLVKVSTEQFAVIEENFRDKDEIQLQTNVKFGLNKENRMIVVLFSLLFTESESPFIKLEVGCHYKIQAEAWENFENKIENQIILPKGFAAHMVVLTVGTVRGVLHAKTENTIFNKFLLPTINVNEIIKEDITLKL